MADYVDTVEKVKQLLSSFIGLRKEKDEISRNDQPKDTTVLSHSQTSSTDARNKELFFERVESFSPLTWFAKPVDLSPLVCATYGWKNIDKDMLQCVNCQVLLCGQLTNYDAILFKESCNKLKKSLVESHNKLCKWRINPCPETYTTIPCDRGELAKSFQLRVNSLSSCSNLPKITYSTLEQYGMDKDKLFDIVSGTKELDSNSDHRTSVADIYALCGWSSSDTQNSILRCEYCLRKIGVWNFCVNEQSDSDTVSNGDNIVIDKDTHVDKTENSTENSAIQCNDNNKDDVNDEPRRKKQKLEKHNFDPVAQHRYWCPWLQTGSPYSSCSQGTSPASSQKTSPVTSPMKANQSSCDADNPVDQGSAHPAWLLSIKTLGHYVNEQEFCNYMKQSPQYEGLKHLRRVLKSCTSPETPRRQLNLKTT